MSAAVGGYGRVSNLELLRAVRYTGIPDRVGDVEAVRRELQVLIDAIPTQISPHERTAYLDAILSDLEDREDAPYTYWPEDLYLLALTCLRYLGRNPLGSTTLFTPPHLQTILHHTALPLPPPASPFLPPSPSPSSAPATEGLRILANLLVLHPAARDAFIGAGGGKALALALAGRDSQGTLIDGDVGVLDGAERVFLLGRLAFLASVEKAEAVRGMVDNGDIVESLCYHLVNLVPLPANYNALAELLKVSMNVIRYYPISPSDTDDWSEKLDPLLKPILALFHTLPPTSLSPPLSTTLHTLLSIPFLPRLLSTWHAIPEPPSPAPSANSVRSLINKISNLGAASPSKRHSLVRTISSSSAESGLGLSGNGLGQPHSRARTSSSRSAELVKPTIRRAKSVTTVSDVSAFPTKVMKVLDGWFDAYLPYPDKPDEVDGKLMVDEVLPPVLLLMARAAAGSGEFRQVFRDQLFPHDLDRSPAAGPLESRQGTLGNVLRLMHSSTHFATRDSAGEFLWSVCDSDAATLTAEIGYGNAAGFLFQKGITAPPSGKIQDIPDGPAPPTTSTSTTAPSARHPISSLAEPLPQSSDVQMTPEEKEREAERLFVLFERMEKNPVIRLTPEDPANPGKGKGVREMMADKLASGELEDKEARAEEEERRREEEEERRDEEEVGREMGRYRARMARLEKPLPE